MRGCAILGLLMVWCAALGYPALIRALGGAWDEVPPDWRAQLSPAARSLAERSLEGLDPERLVDVHVHLVGIGTGGSGCEVHPHMRSWLSPVERVRFELYLSGSGVTELERADQQFIERFMRLVEARPGAGRYCLLAFDHAYTEDGTLDREASEFHVPNEYVWQVAATSERLVPAISVHPYRPDAVDELDRWATRGVRLVKWLPNAMGIDPASPRCDEFYEVMREHGMTLLSHTGKEMAVDADELQALGNPLRLRRPLDAGVRVIAAHCASLGKDLDLDQPEGARELVSSFELFLRLMDEPRYEGLIFGELSALTQVNRLGEPLERLLERRDLHARLVNGSDYPLPALNAVIHLAPLVGRGLLSEEDADGLEELYRAHPVAFDLALKRSLRSPTTGQGFAPEAFLVPTDFGL
jgi:hypothetical protein